MKDKIIQIININGSFYGLSQYGNMYHLEFDEKHRWWELMVESPKLDKKEVFNQSQYSD